jgi:hypothetical protein
MLQLYLLKANPTPWTSPIVKAWFGDLWFLQQRLENGGSSPISAVVMTGKRKSGESDAMRTRQVGDGMVSGMGN